MECTNLCFSNSDTIINHFPSFRNASFFFHWMIACFPTIHIHEWAWIKDKCNAWLQAMVLCRLSWLRISWMWHQHTMNGSMLIKRFLFIYHFTECNDGTHTHEKNCSASWKNVLTWRLLKNVYNKSSFLLKCAEINLLSVGVQLWVLNSYFFFSLTIRVYFIHTVGVRVCPQCSVIVGKLKKS